MSHYLLGTFIWYKFLKNMLDTVTFLLSLTAGEYKSIRKRRIISVPRDTDLPFGKKFLVIIHTKDDNRIIAEYEIDSTELDNHKLKIHFEPIYNAPMGIKLTDLVLLTLTSYSLEEWKEYLDTSTFIDISDRDFNELLSRLKG